MLEILAPILSFIAGGGLIGIITIKAQKKEAEEKTEKIELSNADTIVKMYIQYLVEPLKEEIEILRNEVSSLRGTNCQQNNSILVLSNKIALLTSAIEQIKYCNYSAQCPVTKNLND